MRRVRDPIPLKIRRVCWPGALKSDVVGKRRPLVWCGSLEREVPAQVSSSLSDSGSKLRSPSKSSIRAASKRGVNITKRENGYLHKVSTQVLLPHINLRTATTIATNLESRLHGEIGYSAIWRQITELALLSQTRSTASLFDQQKTPHFLFIMSFLFTDMAEPEPEPIPRRPAYP
ncbi:hypothetical protein AVEN_13862-1 [Araneus ventricosus]|uniref:Uncharacterized protein n=1 Tax=Araneus ventricosus TaxID=182803 RepID=A0A4Y2UPI2_ARAVE|nr:hypothetical protein AVEN_13862-1 [Araneus ventricosus]